MFTRLIKVLFIACLSLIFAVSSTFAQGKGRGHNKNSPPGWEEGEKKGWQSDVPPGLEKKDEKQKKKRNKSKNRKGKKTKSKIEKDLDAINNDEKNILLTSINILLNNPGLYNEFGLMI